MLDESIPEMLRSLPRWITWEMRANAQGRATKVPSCSTLDETRWRTWEEVSGVARTAGRGVGFVTTGEMKLGDHWLIALDIDGCRDATTGVVASWALGLLAAHRNSYTEVTPSRTGLRQWLLLPHRPRMVRAVLRVEAPAVSAKEPSVQVFGLGPAGYVTVTGEQLPTTTTEPAEVPEFAPMLRALEVDDDRAPTGNLPSSSGPRPSPEEITDEILAQPDGEALIEARWREADPRAESASEVWAGLVRMALRAARGHGDAAVEWLLGSTAWGAGLVDDSRDPSKYSRETWVTRDVARVAARMPRDLAPEEVFTKLPMPEAKPTGPVPLIVTTSAFHRMRRPTMFLVDGLIPATGLTQLFGAPGAGKSPVALSLALHVAGKLPSWWGHTVARHGRVLYIVGEGSNGLGYRQQAQREALGLTLDDVDESLLWTTRPARLSDAAECKLWLEAAKKLAGSEGLAMLVVDTQTANFGPGDENEAQDMARFIAHVQALASATGAVALVVHHPGYGAADRGRGSSVQPGAYDAILKVERGGDTNSTVIVTSMKEKDWAKPPALKGALIPRAIPGEQNLDGSALTAITLDTTQAAFAALDPDAVTRWDAGADMRELLDTSVASNEADAIGDMLNWIRTSANSKVGITELRERWGRKVVDTATRSNLMRDRPRREWHKYGHQWQITAKGETFLRLLLDTL